MRPLSDYAWRVLAFAAGTPGIVRQEVNPGVAQRLISDGLVTDVQGPSPYRTHKPGTKVSYLSATEAGLNALRERNR